MTTIDRHGALHAGDGRYASKPQAAAGFDLAVSTPPPRGETLYRVVPEDVWTEHVARDGFRPGAEYWHTLDAALKWADDYESTTGVACRVMGVPTPPEAEQTDDPRGTSHSSVAVPVSQMRVVRTFDGEVIGGTDDVIDGDMIVTKSGERFRVAHLDLSPFPNAVVALGDDNDAVGFLTHKPDTWGDPTIATVYVDPRHRRKGLATGLVRMAERAAPGLRHSDDRSDDAEAWSATTGLTCGPRLADDERQSPESVASSVDGALDRIRRAMNADDDQRAGCRDDHVVAEWAEQP